MLLSDRDIADQIKNGRVVLDPFDPAMIQPSSVDVRLDKYFRVFENHRYPHIDPAEEQPDLTRMIEPAKGEPFILHPGEFVLAATYECVTLPDDVAARLEGKSSLGRLGLLTHSTAGFVDPGFTGHVTLELSNVATLPIKLWPGMKIGQLCFIRLCPQPDRGLARARRARGGAGLPRGRRGTRHRARRPGGRRVSTYWCEHAALPGGVAEGVLVEVDGERFAAVTEAVAVAPAGARVLRGLTLPGLANAHSHAFHRALRARAQAPGNFWSWRDESGRQLGRCSRGEGSCSSGTRPAPPPIPRPSPAGAR